MIQITLNELVDVLRGNQIPEPITKPLGWHIVVLDRGFVYVGDVFENEEAITIENASNIRKWGTTKGLGELVNGPLKDTVLDKVGTVAAYRNAVIHMIRCSGF